MRTVHINGVEWKYRIGRQHTNIWHPFTAKRYNVRNDEISGHYNPDDITPIGPQNVKDYIEFTILNLVPSLVRKKNPEKQPLTMAKVKTRVNELLAILESDSMGYDMPGRLGFLMKLFIRHVARFGPGTNAQEMAREICKVIDNERKIL